RPVFSKYCFASTRKSNLGNAFHVFQYVLDLRDLPILVQQCFSKTSCRKLEDVIKLICNKWHSHDRHSMINGFSCAQQSAMGNEQLHIWMCYKNRKKNTQYYLMRAWKLEKHR
ncbi:hypothetical protein C0J52_08096, partial [Blattella germanica]